MTTFLIVLHVITCILLIVTVLLQFGKGAEMGAIMGSAGASQAVFSSSAKGNFMTKLTTILAIGFMILSITLTIIKSREAKRSLFDNEAPVAAPLNSDVQALDTKDVKTVPPVDGPAVAPADAPASVNDVPAASVPNASPVAPVPATSTPSTTSPGNGTTTPKAAQ